MKNKNLTHINLNQSAEDIHGDICQNIQKISKCSSEACWITLESLMKDITYQEDIFLTTIFMIC